MDGCMFLYSRYSPPLNTVDSKASTELGVNWSKVIATFKEYAIPSAISESLQTITSYLRESNILKLLQVNFTKNLNLLFIRDEVY